MSPDDSAIQTPAGNPDTAPDASGPGGRPAKPSGKRSYLSITLKWSLAITILISISMVVLGWVLIEQQTRMHLQQMEKYGHAIIGQLARSASEPLMADDRFSLEGLVSRQVESGQILGVWIYKSQGAVLAKSGLSPFRSEHPLAGLPEESAGKSIRRIDWSWRDDESNPHNAISFVSPIRFQDVVAGYVVVTLDREELDAGLHRAVQSIAITTLIIILITAVMAFALGRRLSRPIQDLAMAGEAIGKGRLDYRIHDRRQDEIGQIIEAFNHMAHGLLEKSQVEAALSRYVSPHIARKVLTNLDQISMDGEHIEGSVLFCDIVGYTELSENLPADTVANMLNEYFSYITLAGERCHGMVDKFIGDCVMLVFGIPEADEHHGLHAVTCGVLIERLVQQINAQRAEHGQDQLHFRIGINSGSMLAGNVGRPDRMQYTVVGDTVNLASRLCSLGESGQVIINSETASQAGILEHFQLQPLTPIKVRGRSKMVTPLIVEGPTSEHCTQLNDLLEEIMRPGKE